MRGASVSECAGERLSETALCGLVRDLSGRRIETTISKGKHLLTRIEGGITLHSHRVMEGEWAIHPVGERWRRWASTPWPTSTW